MKPVQSILLILFILVTEPYLHGQAATLETAIKYYEQAENLALQTDSLSYRPETLSQVRDLCDSAIAYHPGYGAPRVLKAKLYLMSGAICQKTIMRSKGVFWELLWLGLEELETAMEADTSVQDEALKLINQYGYYLPVANDLLLAGLEPRDKYYFGCWIQREATIKVKANK